MRRNGLILLSVLHIGLLTAMEAGIAPKQSEWAAGKSVLAAAGCDTTYPSSVLGKRKRDDSESSAPESTQATKAAKNYLKTIICTRGTWSLPAADPTLVAHIMQKFGLTHPAAEFLVNRGITTDEAIEQFIHSTYDPGARHPSLMKDANKAVDRLWQAIERNEKILIIGDYDVDGMTSSSMLITCLRPLGALIDYHCPNRLVDGYGIRKKHIDTAKERDCSVVITVDNGIAAFEAGDAARQAGIDLIITDHHLEQDKLPDAYAIVNPNQKQCTYPCKALAGVGVAFKLMGLMYEQVQKELPEKAYELMMLGTIADVVPLVDENRYWVKKGLDQITRTKSPSFKKLVRNGSLQTPNITSTDIAFSIAPQLNAIGRLFDANLGVQFLLDDPEAIEPIGDMLQQYNGKRKTIQAAMMRQLNEMVKNGLISLKDDDVIIASDPGWHLGVNGLVASKAVEKWHKPTLIFTEMRDEQGRLVCKGSGRSTAKFHLFDGLSACKDLFLGFGGHAMAAGLTIEKDKIPTLKERLQHFFRNMVPPKDRKSCAELDGIATFADLTPDTVANFDALGPYGNSNPQPRLLFSPVISRKKPQFLGGRRKKGEPFVPAQHVKAVLEQPEYDEQGRQTGKKEVDANFFFRPDSFYALQEYGQQPMDVVGTVNDNWWGGVHTIGINVIDFEKKDRIRPLH